MSVDLNDRRRKLTLPGLDGAKLKDSGRLFVRERIATLLDPQSFVEVGTFAGTADQENADVVTGYGTVEGRLVYLYAQDFSVKSGSIGPKSADKIIRVMNLAAKTGSPVLALCDSLGARIDQGIQSMDAYARIMNATARLSGVVPQIALVLGPCAGGQAVIAQMADIVIQAKNGCQMISGPQVASAQSGKEYTAETLGGGKVASEFGGAHIVCAEETEALANARKLVSMLPANNQEDAPPVASDDLNRQITSDGKSAVELISQLADFNDVMLLNPDYCRNLATALIRLGGRTVGVVANDPSNYDGIICNDAAKKGARFVRFCDAFSIPLVTLVNSKGISSADAQWNFPMIKAVGQLAYAYAEASVPTISIVTGEAIGTGYAIMASHALGTDVLLAWPDALLAPVRPEAAVKILHKEALEQGVDEPKLVGEYIDDHGAIYAAEAGLVDDVIDPAATRQYVAASLEALLGKRDTLPPRKHGNMPL